MQIARFRVLVFAVIALGVLGAACSGGDESVSEASGEVSDAGTAEGNSSGGDETVATGSETCGTRLATDSSARESAAKLQGRRRETVPKI